jgi:hypothetical protein
VDGRDVVVVRVDVRVDVDHVDHVGDVMWSSK